jgi:hypothetical protein
MMESLFSPRYSIKLARRALASGQLSTLSTLECQVYDLAADTSFSHADTPLLVTLIGEAVFARTLSAIKSERTRANKVIVGPEKETFRGDKKQFIDDLEQALYASKIISYTQGFMLMRETAKELDWHLNYASIARIWRGGCIIKVRRGTAPLTGSDLLIVL